MSTPGAGKVYTSLDAVVVTGAGKVFGAAGFRAISCQVSGITTATVQIQGSNDGTNWDLLEAAITADDIYQVEMGAKYLRGNVTIWTAGAITVTFVGV